MKINVNLVVEVDPKEWNAEFASDDTLEDVAADVRTYVIDAAQSAMAHLPVKVMPREEGQ